MLILLASLMAGVAFAFLMIAEVGLSVFLFDRSVMAHLHHVTDSAGLIGLAGQVAFALFPLLQLGRGH